MYTNLSHNPHDTTASGCLFTWIHCYFRRELASKIKHFSTHVEKHRNKKIQKRIDIGTTTFKKDMIPQHTENKWSQYVVHGRPFGCLKISKTSISLVNIKLFAISFGILAYFVLANQKRQFNCCSSSQTISPRLGLVEKKQHVSNINIHYPPKV